MSTRSGKRIHGSIHENGIDEVTEVKSERKTRGKRQKELEVSSEKTRKHYVRYPSEEDLLPASKSDQLVKSTRKSRKNTLKEQNIVTTDSEVSNDERSSRLNRRTKNTESRNSSENIDPHNKPKTKIKGKKNKTFTAENKKKTNKKKNKRKSGSMTVEDIPQSSDGINNINNTSAMDSFHSAAGSPVYDKKEINYLAPTVRKHDQETMDFNVVNHETHDRPSKATRSKTQSLKNISLEDAGIKPKSRDIKRKRKLTNENACNNSLTTANSDVNDSSNVNTVEPLLAISNNNINLDEQLKDSPKNIPDLNNPIKKFNKKINSTNSRINILSRFENEAVKNVTTAHITRDLNSTDESSQLNSTYDKINDSASALNGACVKDNDDDMLKCSASKYSMIKNRESIFDKKHMSLLKTFDKDILNESEHSLNDLSNLNKGSQKTKRRSTFNRIEELNNTLEDMVTCHNYNKSQKNSASDKINFESISLNNDKKNEKLIDSLKKSPKVTNKVNNDTSIRKFTSEYINDSIINLDTTYEKDGLNVKDQNGVQEKELRKSKRQSKFSLDQDISSLKMNTTYDKNSISGSEAESTNNSTFSKSVRNNTSLETVKNKKLDVTFDKTQKSDTRRGSSLISSDSTDNVPSDTSKDISRISITSDESSIDNIVNATPVLIESSMDESKVSSSPYDATETQKVNAENKKPHKNFEEDKDVTTLEIENTEHSLKKNTDKENVAEVKISTTPLKREGTYTEIKYSTPPKRQGTFTEDKGTPKNKETPESKGSDVSRDKHSNVVQNTVPIPLKREGTYTELIPLTTQTCNDATNREISLKTPKKMNGLVENKIATPPLKREGTFTKDSDVPESPKLQTDVIKTPTRRKSLPSPGRTPFLATKSLSKDTLKAEKSMLNVTMSVEKSNRRSSMVDYLPRATKVMFCSPVATPMVAGQMKGKVIKSNLKGSDKSFVFDESLSVSQPPRKRSYTQSEAEARGAKRSRLAAPPAAPLAAPLAAPPARTRSASASGKLQDPGTPSKTEVTPSKSKSEGKVLRTKLPNFAALHQKQFAKMESLYECQERKAKRARQLLTPTGSVNLIERISPKEPQTLRPTEPITQAKKSEKSETPKKSTKPAEQHGYTRFGFKLNMDVNPFSFPAKTETKPRESRASQIKPLKRQATLPSLTGATTLRKEAAKQTILREKSFTEKRGLKRVENRTVIKGVRTNRRFELQMKMRNVK